MKINQNQVGDRRQVGTVDGKALHLIVTKGGLHLLVKEKDKGDGEILGAGAHVAVARHIARQRNPNIKWSELSKSDPVEYVHFEACVPFYEEITTRLRKAHGDE